MHPSHKHRKVSAPLQPLTLIEPVIPDTTGNENGIDFTGRKPPALILKDNCLNEVDQVDQLHQLHQVHQSSRPAESVQKSTLQIQNNVSNPDSSSGIFESSVFKLFSRNLVGDGVSRETIYTARGSSSMKSAQDLDPHSNLENTPLEKEFAKKELQLRKEFTEKIQQLKRELNVKIVELKQELANAIQEEREKLHLK